MPRLSIKICWSNRKNVQGRIQRTHSCHQKYNGNSGYSNHILNTGHTHGTITDNMDIIRAGRKGRHLDTSEKYHVYKISRNNLHMNDTYTEAYNPIFQTVHELHDR
jgi:hypothetical protein